MSDHHPDFEAEYVAPAIAEIGQGPCGDDGPMSTMSDAVLEMAHAAFDAHMRSEFDAREAEARLPFDLDSPGLSARIERDGPRFFARD